MSTTNIRHYTLSAGQAYRMVARFGVENVTERPECVRVLLKSGSVVTFWDANNEAGREFCLEAPE